MIIMKKILMAMILAVVGLNLLKAQSVVINEKLLAQLTKNHTVRLASNSAILSSYEKQKKLYDDINLQSSV